MTAPKQEATNILTQITVGALLTILPQDSTAPLTAQTYPGTSLQFIGPVVGSTHNATFVVNQYDFVAGYEAKIALQLQGQPLYWNCAPTTELGTGVILSSEPQTIMLYQTGEAAGNVLTLGAPFANPDCGGVVGLRNNGTVDYLNYCYINEPSLGAAFSVNIVG